MSISQMFFDQKTLNLEVFDLVTAQVEAWVEPVGAEDRDIFANENGRTHLGPMLWNFLQP